MLQEPGKDRSGPNLGFNAFRKTLMEEGRLPNRPRPGGESGKAPVRTPSGRLNVLWLMADQLRADTLGCAGHPFIQTPNIDRLASRGVLLQRSYCNSPVCGPSRAAMLTGRYLYANGVIENNSRMRDGLEVMGTFFKRAGYRTASIGKTHCGRSSADVWEYHAEVEDAFGATKPSKVAFDASIYPHATFIGEPSDDSDRLLFGAYPGPVQTSKSHHLATEAMKFLYWQDDPRPFFLRVSFDDPHPPVVPPEPYYSMYRPEDVPSELIGTIASMHDKPQVVQDFWRFSQFDTISVEDHRKHAAVYCGFVSHLDAQIGRILDYLDQSEFADNTLVVFNSDHGHMIGENMLCHKGVVCYEGVSQIPLIFSKPGMLPEGTTSEALNEGVDLLPTLLDLCEIPVPEDLDGWSLEPVLKGIKEEHRAAAFVQWADFGFCVIEKDWKLIWYDAGDEGELYHLPSDPYEKCNRIADPECAEHRKRLKARLESWRAEHASTSKHPYPLTT